MTITDTGDNMPVEQASVNIPIYNNLNAWEIPDDVGGANINRSPMSFWPARVKPPTPQMQQADAKVRDIIARMGPNEQLIVELAMYGVIHLGYSKGEWKEAVIAASQVVPHWVLGGGLTGGV